MNGSSLIFVALAVAWALYLIPQALQHHEESLRSRTVDKFSATMRVIARRDAVDRRSTALITRDRPGRTPAPAASVNPAAPVSAPAPVPEPAAAPRAPAVQQRVSRAAAARAARRRMRVVTTLLFAVVVVAALWVGGVISPVWILAPVALLALWLVACRLMVRRERSAPAAARLVPAAPVEFPTEPVAAPVDLDEGPATEEIMIASGLDRPAPASTSAPTPVHTSAAHTPAQPGMWDPMAVQLPTYVSKPPAARRTVRTIDLDSTGVWSSGRNEGDSQIAREAEAAERDARRDGSADGGTPGRRAAGS